MFPGKRQEGVALVGILMILLVLTLLGSTAYLVSTTEINISSNYDQSVQALYAAEAGLQHLLYGYRQNPHYFFLKKKGQEMDFPTWESDRSNQTGPQFWLEELRYDPQDPPTYAEVKMVGKGCGQNGLCRIRATIYCDQSGGTSDVSPIFKTGIVTAGQIYLSGSLEILGNLHANQGYSINPSTVIDQMKQNQYSATQSTDPEGPDYLPPKEVPTVSKSLFQEFQLTSLESTNQNLFGQQNLVLSGNQKNLLIFIDGDLTLQGNNLYGVTIVATGSITLNGSTRLSEEHWLDTVFIAGQDIILNDFSEAVGVFWSNGVVKKTGPGRLLGSIVCQGNIYQSGGLQFERISQISNTYLSHSVATYSFSLSGWVQM